MSSRASAIAAITTLVGIVSAQHSVSVVNNCGYGTPMMTGPDTGGLISIPNGYSTSGDMTGWIIFLQNGSQCGSDGQNCLPLEGTLTGSGYSQVDISLIAPHAFNSPLAFSYTDGSGGRSCASASCECDYDAFCQSTDYGAQVGSPSTTASITVTFC
ncbi:hypothetical protein FIBSPDRAFT_252756 [Athelia psychrophila]|uniref:Glycopeptide n=1 Tax=Athelia psychrophila TaxID=1759441 RepID=A0A165XRG2_9AGAM|nr:hypothetical protein FIBSPDRAFT_252756 [Fibularhizoctonia sp. CBS 109695]